MLENRLMVNMDYFDYPEENNAQISNHGLAGLCHSFFCLSLVSR